MAMKITTLCFLLLLSFLLLGPAEAAVSCGVVDSRALPCVGFVTGSVPRPPPACCSGLQQLARGARTVWDRRAICRCLQNGVKAFPGVKDRYLSQVPRLCHIPVGFPVSLNTNCDRIN